MLVYNSKNTKDLIVCYVRLFNGLFYGAAVAYYTYIYAKVDKEHFERVTSHTNAATLAGRTSSGILAQILVSVKWMDVEQLNYISLGGE
jgi:thiamine transporter 2/3